MALLRTISHFPLLLSLAVLISPSAYGAEKLNVVLFDDAGSFGKGIPRVIQLLQNDPAIELTTLDAAAIRERRLDGVDVVIFTGGSGSKQAAALGEEGTQIVADFVKNGGGYVGICAGAYLACDGFVWSAKLLNARTISKKWRRGKGMLPIELTEDGRKIFSDVPEKFEIRYANGPVIQPAGNALPSYRTLALFRGELAENETPAGIMIDSPAIVEAEFGKGRVIAISPHPEQTTGLETMVVAAVKRVGEKSGATQSSTQRLRTPGAGRISRD